jgi:hypothetical protein
MAQIVARITTFRRNKRTSFRALENAVVGLVKIDS